MADFIPRLIAAGGEVYEVGGSVRDALLGRPIKDRDLIVRLLSFEKIRTLLSPLGKVSLVGKSFGVLKFRPRGEDREYDIALPRKEVSTGAGHRDFAVDFDPDLPLVVDLGRRDFTVNAMARALPHGTLIDPFGGEADLKHRVLRQVFREAFVEDPLRLMRAVQFAARFRLSLDPETLDSMRQHAATIEHIAPERIIEEVRKLFSADQPSIGFRLMRETGLLERVFPAVHAMIGVQQPKKDDDVFDHTMKVFDASRNTPELDYGGDPTLMFAALFHDAGKPRTVGFSEEKQDITFYGHQIVSKHIARKWMKRYKVETIGVDPNEVMTLVEHHMFEAKSFFSDKSIRRFVRKVGPDHIIKLLDLRISDKKGGRFPDKLREIIKLKRRVVEELNKKPPFGPKDLALNGHDLMALGIPAGPQMGNIIHHLLDLVVDQPEMNTRETLTAWLRENVAKAALTPSVEPPREDADDESARPE